SAIGDLDLDHADCHWARTHGHRHWPPARDALRPRRDAKPRGPLSDSHDHAWIGSGSRAVTLVGRDRRGRRKRESYRGHGAALLCGARRRGDGHVELDPHTLRRRARDSLVPPAACQAVLPRYYTEHRDEKAWGAHTAVSRTAHARRA